MAEERRNDAGSSNTTTHVTLTHQELANVIAQAVATYANMHTPAPQNQSTLNQNQPRTLKTFMDCELYTGGGNKRKRDNDNTKNQAQPPQQQKKFKTSINLGTTKSRDIGYKGKMPLCNSCNYHHTGACIKLLCKRCGKMGHSARFCRGKMPTQPTPFTKLKLK